MVILHCTSLILSHSIIHVTMVFCSWGCAHWEVLPAANRAYSQMSLRCVAEQTVTVSLHGCSMQMSGNVAYHIWVPCTTCCKDVQCLCPKTVGVLKCQKCSRVRFLLRYQSPQTMLFKSKAPFSHQDLIASWPESDVLYVNSEKRVQ